MFHIRFFIFSTMQHTIKNIFKSDKKEPDTTTYKDIGGLDKEVETVREMVELPLKHPEVFQRFGITPPKGLLLYGPPGCGKTLIARAVANETDAHFIAVNASDIIRNHYGESEQRSSSRQLFLKYVSASDVRSLWEPLPSRNMIMSAVHNRAGIYLISSLPF